MDTNKTTPTTADHLDTSSLEAALAALKDGITTNPTTATGPLGNETFPVRIKLTKNTKGYSWEIAVGGDAEDVIITRICRIDADMRANFGESDV